MTQHLVELIRGQGLFRDLPDEAISLIEGCAGNVVFRPGDLILEEGKSATTFMLLRRGHVALEIHRPGGGALIVETIGPGGVVGWSWLFPPYRWHFDARAIDAVGAIAIDGACLRDKADADPTFGYELIKSVAAVMLDRLQATRLRLLDVYGDVDAR